MDSRPHRDGADRHHPRARRLQRAAARRQGTCRDDNAATPVPERSLRPQAAAHAGGRAVPPVRQRHDSDCGQRHQAAWVPLRNPGGNHRFRHGHPAPRVEVADDPRHGEGSRGRRADVPPRRHDRRRAVPQGHRALAEGLRGRGQRHRAGLRQVQPDLDDDGLGRPRQHPADPPACRYARPDGRPHRPDHRPADHGQLHRGAHRARVLHLDPRHAQGPRRHRPPYRRLRLPDAASRRRRPGRDSASGGLRHHQRDLGPRHHPRAGEERAHFREDRRPYHRRGHRRRRQGARRCGIANQRRRGTADDRSGSRRQDALRARVRSPRGRLPHVLRP